MKNRYFSAEEAGQFTFFRIPKALMTLPEYRGISVEAKFLYGMMLDRMGLSEKNHWYDDDGSGGTKVYIYFTIETAAGTLSCGRGKAIRLFQELEQADLIERDRQGCGHPSKVFVKDFKREVQKTDLQKFEDETSESPDSEPQEVPKPDASKTQKNKNDVIEIYPSICTEEMEDEIREQLEYDIFVERYPLRKEKLDRIVNLIADTLMAKSETVRIGGADVPKGRVEERFRTLCFDHVEYVLDRMEETTTDIRNIRAYLLTALYNAPVTMDSYYDAMVLRDMPWLAKK